MEKRKRKMEWNTSRINLVCIVWYVMPCITCTYMCVCVCERVLQSSANLMFRAYFSYFAHLHLGQELILESRDKNTYTIYAMLGAVFKLSGVGWCMYVCVLRKSISSCNGQIKQWSVIAAKLIGNGSAANSSKEYFQLCYYERLGLIVWFEILWGYQ